MTETILETRKVIAMKGITDALFLITDGDAIHETDDSELSRINQLSNLINGITDTNPSIAAQLIQASSQWTAGMKVHDDGTAFDGLARWVISTPDAALSIINTMTFTGANDPLAAITAIREGQIVTTSGDLVSTAIIWLTSSSPIDGEKTVESLNGIPGLAILQVGRNEDLVNWLSSIESNNILVRDWRDIRSFKEGSIISLAN
jgi:hypothetical protein